MLCVEQLTYVIVQWKGCHGGGKTIPNWWNVVDIWIMIMINDEILLEARIDTLFFIFYLSLHTGCKSDMQINFVDIM